MTSITTLRPDEIARFWAKMDRSDPAACWNWTGWTTPQGYGRFDLGSQKVLATHLALTLSGSPRPESPGDNALHGDNCTPACCNPSHLRWGTKAENTDDRDRLGRRVPDRGEAHGNAKLTEADVRLIRSSPLSQYKLAAMLGVSQPLVGKVRNRVLWTHVD